MTETPPLQIRTLGGIERCQPQAGLEGPKTRLGGTEGRSGARTGHAPDIELEPRLPSHSSDETDVGQSAGSPGCLEAEPWIERAGDGMGVHGSGEVVHPLSPPLGGDQPFTGAAKS